MGSYTPPPLPREHGAWTMLVIPMVFGLAAGGGRVAAAWLVPAATALVFLAHHALVPWAQRAREGRASPPGYAARRLVWGASYLALAGIVFAGATIAAEPGARAGLVAVAGAAAALAGVYAIAAMFGYARTIVAEGLGLAGVALVAPMILAASRHPLDRRIAGGAVLALAYFLSSVAFVRAYDRMRAERGSAIRACLLVHVALAVLLIAVAVLGALPSLWWIAFVPVVARTFWGLAAPPANLRALGMREVAIALTFTALGAILLSIG
jgi:hypothetical protein